MKKLICKIRNKLKKTLFPHRRVDFVICGTQKGGTSALDAYLREHPEICMANKKEVHYFDNDFFFTNGKPDYSLYHRSFSPNPLHKVLGEATPIYMYWSSIPKRLFEYNPNLKVIILLRNPIERAYSHWNMEVSKNNEYTPFLEALSLEKKRCEESFSSQHRDFSYIDRGKYLKQLQRIWKHFPKEMVLILKSEDLRENPNKTLRTVTNFLCVSPFNFTNKKDVHSLPYITSMSKHEKDYLRSVFESEIQKLEDELKWDCSNWLD